LRSWRILAFAGVWGKARAEAARHKRADMLDALFSAYAVNLRREIISPNGLIAELCGNAFARCGCCGRVAVWQARKKRLKHEARVNGNMDRAA